MAVTETPVGALHAAPRTTSDVYARLESVTSARVSVEKTEPYLLFGLGQYTLAVPLSFVQGVERPGRFTAVPFAAPWLRGVTAVRGEVLTVVDLGRFAGGDPAGLSPGARLVVVRAAGISVALLVDRVVKITDLPTIPGLLPDRTGPLSTWCSGAHTYGGEVVPVVDVSALLSSPDFHQCQLPSGVNYHAV
jgi:purine-binding chemotaxis protein CheW